MPVHRLSVKRPGIRKPKERVVNPKKQATHGRRVARMFDKNKCWDLF